jgi:hypothetical protein
MAKLFYCPEINFCTPTSNGGFHFSFERKEHEGHEEMVANKTPFSHQCFRVCFD